MTILYDRVVVLRLQTSEQQYIYENMYITFAIEKDDKSSSNTLKGEIYNLNRDSQAAFTEKDAKVELLAGYDGVAELIFKGDLSFSSTIKQDDGTISTRFEAVDGGKVLRDKFISESFSAGSSLSTVIDKLSRTLNVVIKEVPNFDDTFKQGFSVSGSVRSVLDQLKESYDFNWTIDDDELQIIKKDKTSSEVVVVLNSTTGLIGFPERAIIGNDPKQTTYNGVKGTSLLNPQLRVNRSMNLESTFITGKFKITKVSHLGDNFGGPFETTFEALTIE